jgi:hypothetical protein
MARTDRPHVRGALKPAAAGCPRGEDRTYTLLSEQFRAGRLFAYAWDRDSRCWLTWASEADWLATERNGTVRVPAAGRGPVAYEPPASVRRRPGKAEYVSLLRRIADGVDWNVAELEGLLERETV